MINQVITKQFKQKDISEIDLNNSFFHYTNKENLYGISKNGLEPRIGENSIYVEKSKKVFFAIGKIGILNIMDTWLKWLTAKSTVNHYIYHLGIIYMKLPLCIKSIPNKFVNRVLNKKDNRIKVYEQMKKILDNSVFLILDLEENIDFDYNDTDEVKNTYYESFLKLLYPSFSNIKDKKMEYWNMHTYSNKIIDFKKISLLKENNEYSAELIVKHLIENNLEYVKENLSFLYEYYIYNYTKRSN